MDETREWVVKCTFDGTWDDNGAVWGIGVVVRNKMGDFVAAIVKKIGGIGSPLLAQTIAASEVVSFTRTLAGTQMEFEGDALLIAAHQRDARQILKSFPHWKVTFGQRGTDKVAHRLARLNLTLCNQINWFEEPPSVISDIF